MKLCSVTITSRTKEAIIGAALRSVLPWVDLCAVLVIPGGDDRTLEVAQGVAGEKLRLKLLPEGGDIPSWRNAGLDFATELGCDKAVVLDTDERIHTNGLAVRSTLSSNHAEVLSILDVSGDYDKPRFFSLPTKARYSSHTHEELLNATPIPLPRMRFSELPKTAEQNKARNEGILAGLAGQMEAEPANYRWPYYYGVTLAHLGEPERALGYLRKAFDLCGEDNKFCAWIQLHIAANTLAEDKPGLALVEATFGLRWAPWMPELHMMAAQASAEMGQWDDAKAWAHTAVLHGSSAEGLNHRRVGLRDSRSMFEGPYEIISLACEALGDKQGKARATALASKARLRRLAFNTQGIY